MSRMSWGFGAVERLVSRLGSTGWATGCDALPSAGEELPLLEGRQFGPGTLQALAILALQRRHGFYRDRREPLACQGGKLTGWPPMVCSRLAVLQALAVGGLPRPARGWGPSQTSIDASHPPISFQVHSSRGRAWHSLAEPGPRRQTPEGQTPVPDIASLGQFNRFCFFWGESRPGRPPNIKPMSASSPSNFGCCPCSLSLATARSIPRFYIAVALPPSLPPPPRYPFPFRVVSAGSIPSLDKKCSGPSGSS